MEALLALALVLGVPLLATAFIVREARLYRDRELARRAKVARLNRRANDQSR